MFKSVTFFHVTAFSAGPTQRSHTVHTDFFFFTLVKTQIHQLKQTEKAPKPAFTIRQDKGDEQEEKQND